MEMSPDASRSRSSEKLAARGEQAAVTEFQAADALDLSMSIQSTAYYFQTNSSPSEVLSAIKLVNAKGNYSQFLTECFVYRQLHELELGGARRFIEAYEASTEVAFFSEFINNGISTWCVRGGCDVRERMHEFKNFKDRDLMGEDLALRLMIVALKTNRSLANVVEIFNYAQPQLGSLGSSIAPLLVEVALDTGMSFERVLELYFKNREKFSFDSVTSAIIFRDVMIGESFQTLPVQIVEVQSTNSELATKLTSGNSGEIALIQIREQLMRSQSVGTSVANNDALTLSDTAWKAIEDLRGTRAVEASVIEGWLQRYRKRFQAKLRVDEELNLSSALELVDAI